MCCSFIGQIVYGALMLIALGLTLGSMFSPGWTKLEDEGKSSVEDLKHFKLPSASGIFPFLCRMPENINSNDNSTDNSTVANGTTTAAYGTTTTANPNSVDYCADFWKNLPTWEKVVVAMMCLALIGEVVAVVITLVSICACCFKRAFLFLLPIMALIISIFLLVAVVLFAVKNRNFVDNVLDQVNPQNLTVNEGQAYKNIKEGMKSQAGYSFYLAVGALIAALIDIVIGGLAQCFAKCFL